jgi:hypothetical protein
VEEEIHRLINLCAGCYKKESVAAESPGEEYQKQEFLEFPFCGVIPAKTGEIEGYFFHTDK